MVIVIDDDERVREALAGLLSAAELNATFFSSATEYIEAPRLACPACLVVDVGLSDINGLELQAQIAEKFPPPIVFITGRGDVPSSVRAMKAGAIDFLTKPFSEKDFLAAVTAAIAKDRESRRMRAERLALEERSNSLTPREREVMALVASGLLNKQAAALLGISEMTLQIHRGKVMKKMKANSLAELVRMADTLKMPIHSPESWPQER
ncbi:response regulator transcription factor [Variovorax sp. GT1P44]|uniref:response regulator transcription factor n=1 Tax=Variovorax sp. GT1P44 TaxID=3443742 RepID=UPI003F47FE9F